MLSLRLFFVTVCVCVCLFCSFHQERPYQHDSTASRLLSEVKHVRAQLVLRWGTTLESWVLFFCKFWLLGFANDMAVSYILRWTAWCARKSKRDYDAPRAIFTKSMTLRVHFWHVACGYKRSGWPDLTPAVVTFIYWLITTSFSREIVQKGPFTVRFGWNSHAGPKAMHPKQVWAFHVTMLSLGTWVTDLQKNITFWSGFWLTVAQKWQKWQ